MSLRTSTRTCLRFIRSCAFVSIGLLVAAQSVMGGGAFDLGTPAESKGGLSGLATFAQDKVETVNLTNGNLNIHIPLVTILGRGSASFTIALNYNSKLWSAHTEIEMRQDCQSCPPFPVRHNTATRDDLLGNTPNSLFIGSGWSILRGPGIKVKRVDIDPITCAQVQGDVFKYVLTKVWLVLPDGSEIEMRDDLTDGAPYFKPNVCSNPGQLDQDRGRVWHSTDGKAITYVTDAPNGVVNGQLSGYVFVADGTRLNMSSTGRCTKIIDPNGNWLRINYNAPVSGAVTYTDQLGRDVILQSSGNNITVTVKGYGLLDRTITIVKNSLFPGDNTTAAPNLRSDYDVGGANFMPRPFISGDYENTSQGVNEHAIYGAQVHTDVIAGSDLYGGYTPVSDEPGAPGTGVQGVTQLNLLDGRSFVFRYNPWGEVAEIVYPGGGISQIDYAPFGSFLCQPGTLTTQMNRRVVERRNYPSGAGSALDCKWTYGWGSQIVDGTNRPFTSIEARQGGSDALLMSEKHFFLARDAEYRQCGPNGLTFLTGNPKFENGTEFRVERQIGGGQMQVEERLWENRAPQSWGVIPYTQEHPQEQSDNDPRVPREDTTLENGKVKRVRYDYDAFNNVTSLKEYDFGQGVQGTLVRETNRTYLSSQNGYCYTNLKGVDGNCGGALYTIPDEAIHRRRLLLTETVTNSVSSTVEAFTEYEYDNYVNEGPSGNHAPIQTNAGMIQYENWFTPFAVDKQPRGNVTSVKRLVSGLPPPGTGTYVTAYSQYDEGGNVVKSKDPLGNSTMISYQDNFGDGSNPDVGVQGTNGATFAFPTSATNALLHEVKTQYHYSRGVVTGVKDANGVITRTEYTDPYDRPFRVTAAYNLPEATKTEFTYPTASANQTTVSKQLDAARWLASKTTYDGFARPLTANEAEDGLPAGSASFTIFSKQIYDGLGRVKFATNPHRASGASTDGWTRSAYDLAGRVIQVATFTGGPSSTPPEYPATTGTGVTWTGSVTTTYASEQTTVEDQAGKKRRSIVDGLGRLVRVDEPDSSGNLDTGNPPQPVQPTAYGYDARGNLKTVTQGTQPQRTFSYDLLSRLTQASNPESGTINYTYDANSNLKTKQDARLITTTYNYDVLNRVISRIYTNDPESTPAVNYYYDSQPLPSGAPTFTRGSSTDRLVAVCYGGPTASAGSYMGYDSLGRANVSVQQTDGNNYSFSYGYNLGGLMTSETYPSQRQVTNAYDGAGRISSINGQKTGEPNKTYGSTFSYTAHGAVSAMQLGNAKWEHTTFNSRLQPTEIGLGTSSTDSSILRLDYGYGTTTNNGNVLTQTITAPGLTVTQCYGYDLLNRLSMAEERSGSNCTGTQQWKQAFTYDRYGNRNFDAANTTANVLGPNPTINQTNNRFATGQNYGYDNAGNLTSEPATNANGIVYDAESRQTKYTKTGQATNEYYYDGDGRRVKKVVPGSPSTTTIFVYNVVGQLIAEYTSDPVPPPAGGGGTSYLTSDHLGSTRVVTKQDGSVKARYDYLPFGEEIPSTIGGRSSVVGYSAPDSTKQKFTQKERDAESGLDYFLARYYSSAQGRFTSPDEFTGGPDELYDFAEAASDNPTFYGDLQEPQSLNKYQYCYNNPLSYIDPDGHKSVLKRRKIGTSATGIVATAASMAQSPNPAVAAIGTGLVVLGLIGEALFTRTPEPVPVSDTQTEAQPTATTPPETQAESQPQATAQPQAQPTTPPPPPLQPQKIDRRSGKPKKDRTTEGATRQRADMQKAQDTVRRRGQPNKIRDITKSKQNEKTALRRIKRLKDVEDQ